MSGHLGHRIGVFDFETLTQLLRDTWTRLYDSPPRDPQDITQAMEAEILRRRADCEDVEDTRG